MKWEYAAFEQINARWTVQHHEDSWPETYTEGGSWWVVRSDRSERFLKLVAYKTGLKAGQLKSWEGALYANKDPFQVFMEAAKEGWEMTSSIPVGPRMHFQTGDYLGATTCCQ